MNISAVNNYQVQNRNQTAGQNKRQNICQNTSFKAFRATEGDTLTINNLIKNKLSWLKDDLTSRRIMRFAEELFGKNAEETKCLRSIERFAYPRGYHCYIPRVQENNIRKFGIKEQQRAAIEKAIGYSDPVSPRDAYLQSMLYNGKSSVIEKAEEKEKVTSEMFDLLVQAKDLKEL